MVLLWSLLYSACASWSIYFRRYNKFVLQWDMDGMNSRCKRSTCFINDEMIQSRLWPTRSGYNDNWINMLFVGSLSNGQLGGAVDSMWGSYWICGTPRSTDRNRPELHFFVSQLIRLGRSYYIGNHQTRTWGPSSLCWVYTRVSIIAEHELTA